MFGCQGHAEKDRASGKWLCLPSVANALAYSAGIDQQLDLPPNLTFSSAEDFRERLPLSALTSRRGSSKSFFAVRSGEEIPLPSPEEAREIASGATGADPDLLTEAILLGSALTPLAEDAVRSAVDPEMPPPLVAKELAGLLGDRYWK
ncbi:MAG TPA: hypothetical protein VLI94_11905 [Solirubrobacterales bacterium]|nr:hypothetical protein [Solirubrobacterales bacterium]